MGVSGVFTGRLSCLDLSLTWRTKNSAVLPIEHHLWEFPRRLDAIDKRRDAADADDVTSGDSATPFQRSMRERREGIKTALAVDDAVSPFRAGATLAAESASDDNTSVTTSGMFRRWGSSSPAAPSSMPRPRLPVVVSLIPGTAFGTRYSHTLPASCASLAQEIGQ